MSVTDFVTVDLVMSPEITASLCFVTAGRHSAWLYTSL